MNNKPEGWRGERHRHYEAKVYGKASPRVARSPAYPTGSGTLFLGNRYAQRIEGEAVVPIVLYHGTSMKNLKRIMNEGMIINSEPNPETASQGFMTDTKDCISFAKKEKDTRIFAAMSAGIGNPRVILTINTSYLPEGKFVAKSLWGKKDAEFQYYGNIPPQAIRNVRVIRFGKNEKGKTEVYEDDLELWEFKDAIERGLWKNV
jgi:hypothetical protein